MNQLREALTTFVDQEEGQDMVEYVLLSGFISVVAIAIILVIGPYLDNTFQHIVNALGTI